MKTVGVVLACVVLQGCTLFGVRMVDEPDYTVQSKQGDIEIRQYPPLVVAETVVDGSFSEAQDEAFRRLFDYISGANSGDQEIDMTAPVLIG
ncbi:MAG: heme-binding protein, partial [Bdellovibrionales bacterium]|nr:heme-binding protein [Bdellovibrionales bacterium]